MPLIYINDNINKFIATVKNYLNNIKTLINHAKRRYKGNNCKEGWGFF